MAVAVSSSDDFKEKFEALKHSRSLFAFFLFDDRPSNEAVERFAHDEFVWLDDLAASAGIFFFIFLRHDPVDKRVANPSLEVGRMFGIRPNQLPGVVLFTLAEDKEGVSDGVYLPLKAELFTKDISCIEQVFSDLFSLIQECQEMGGSQSEILENLRRRVRRLRRQERMRPIYEYAKGSLASLATFPREIMNSVATAFGQEAARRVASGT